MKQKNKAVFLDRDGVINQDTDHLRNMADFRLLPGAAQALRVIKERGYLVIVVTNQAAVAKGMLSLDQLESMHEEIKQELARHGAEIDAIYYCPHHPDGIVPEYAIKCDCRKPGVGMIIKAIKEFDIDLSKSFLVGDKTGDILAGTRAGLTTILVRTGYGGQDGKFEASPDFTADDLKAALRYIKPL